MRTGIDANSPVLTGQLQVVDSPPSSELCENTLIRMAGTDQSATKCFSSERDHCGCSEDRRAATLVLIANV